MATRFGGSQPLDVWYGNAPAATPGLCARPRQAVARVLRRREIELHDEHLPERLFKLLELVMLPRPHFREWGPCFVLGCCCRVTSLLARQVLAPDIPPSISGRTEQLMGSLRESQCVHAPQVEGGDSGKPRRPRLVERLDALRHQRSGSARWARRSWFVPSCRCRITSSLVKHVLAPDRTPSISGGRR